MKKKIKFSWMIIPLAISIIIGLAIYLKSEENATSTDDELITFDTMEDEKKETVPKEIFVDIKGAVHSPGVYKLKENMRMKDLITLAGGFKEAADITRVNLAALLHDEQLVIVPNQGDIGRDKENNNGKININIASEQELQDLPGIGPSKAAEIIKYREESGRFQRIEDLLQVSGIGERSFQTLKDFISIY